MTRSSVLDALTISGKSLDTSIPRVIYAMTFFITSRFFVGSLSNATARKSYRSSFTSPFLWSTKNYGTGNPTGGAVDDALT
jgi:hypothetical protein